MLLYLKLRNVPQALTQGRVTSGSDMALGAHLFLILEPTPEAAGKGGTERAQNV